jgi:beta-N-acetylhexosaminidase
MTSTSDLQKAVGKLMLGRLPGYVLDEDSQKALSDGIIGGAVLFKENGEDLSQLIALCDAIVNNSFHAPIISVDEEGGAVQRFDHILMPMPSPMALAAIQNPERVEHLVSALASQLQAIGFNCLLAPCLDVLSTPQNPVIATRAFSDNPKLVGYLAEQVIDAITASGLVAVGKHFPGHGSTLEDSHLGLARNKFDETTLWQTDLEPYRMCLNKLQAIMLGHIWLSAVEAKPLPATLSKKITQGILRKYLGFTGVIMTDDMLMKGITEHYGLAEASVMALEAGADVLLTCDNAVETRKVNEYIAAAVNSGRLTEARIQESINRIEKCFPKIVIKDLEVNRAKLKENISQEKTVSFTTSIKAISQLKGAVPDINSGNWLVIAPSHGRYPMKLAQHLRDCLKQGKFAKKDFDLQFTEIRYPLNPSSSQIQEIAVQCAERNCIYLTYRTLSNDGQKELGKALAENAREIVAVATDVPYDVLALPEIENCLATFDPSEQAMSALARVLLRAEPPTGHCPVKLQLQLTG